MGSQCTKCSIQEEGGIKHIARLSQATCPNWGGARLSEAAGKTKTVIKPPTQD